MSNNSLRNNKTFSIQSRSHPSRLNSVKLLSKIMREMPNSSLIYYMSIIQATLSTPELIINRITKYLTNIKLDDTWRGTNESFLLHYNDQLRLLDSLVDSDEKLPDNARVTFLESAVESVPDLRRVKITDNVLQAQLDSTKTISYRSYFDLLKDAAFHLDQATIRGSKIRHTNVHFFGPNDEEEHQTLSSDDNQVIQQENVCSEPPEPLSYSLFHRHFQGLHPALRRSSFPNLSGKSSPKINNK